MTVARWAESLQRDGDAARAYEVGGYDPVRVRAIFETCTPSDVAEAWAHLKAAQEGVGFKIEK